MTVRRFFEISATALACASISAASAAMPAKVPDLDVSIEGAHTLRILPPSGHHLNAEAPSEAKKEGKALRRTRNDPSRIEFAVTGEALGITGSAYLCDDKNTFCVKKEFSLFSATSPKPGASSSPLQKGLEHGFIRNDPEAAFREARSKKKPLLIDFYAIWCPPCNVMDHSVFSKKEFQGVGAGFVRLKLDGDHPLSWVYKDRYRIRGYPTFLFADHEGNEISRVVGSRRFPDFIEETKKAYSLRGDSLARALERAKKGDSPAMFRVGVQALERGEYAQALDWFEKDSRNWKSGDRRFEKLYSARMEKLLADDSSKQKPPTEISKLIREAISKTSPSWFQIDSAQKLAALEEAVGNESGMRSAWESLVSTAKEIEKNPVVLTGEEAEIRDVLIARGDAEKELGRMEDSRATFLRAAENVKELLRGMGAEAHKERGWQLDLAYSLRRAGKTKEAEALYRSLIHAYPREFTYHNQLARFLLEEKRFADAEKAAREAYSFSYGDNRLRTAKVLADALSNQGKYAEAVSFLHQTLSETKAPSNPLNSTNYHLKTLKALETKLAAKAAGQK